MIARVVRLTAWLLIGATCLSGLYWLFLNTPETNALTLGASAVLLLTILVLTALVVNAAILMGGGTAFLTSLTKGLRGTLWFIAVLVPLALIWWGLTAAHTWTTDHSGEINAWFIARFGWANISPLLRTEMWMVRWLSWVVAPLAAVSLLAGVLERGARGFGDRWLRRAWHWRTLLLATLVFVLLFVLPWQLTAWRPALPATWVEPTVAGIRLVAVMLLWALGAALLVLLSVNGRSKAPAAPLATAQQP
jgi:hypothetical protein